MKSREDINRFIRDQRSEENLSGLPLKGVRIIDIATVYSAPYSATLMADFGAEVIKVENPRIPDAPRAFLELETGIQPYWATLARNKFPVTINLKSEDGKRILLELIEKSDVLLENMRTGIILRVSEV